MRMFGKKKKCNKKFLRRYPCDTYLKNALHFIEVGEIDDAYLEICWAILKSGGELSGRESKRFYELRDKE